MVLLGRPNYAALAATIDTLPSVVTATRQSRTLDVATAAGQIGITKTTLANFETRATRPTLATVRLVLQWLG